MRTSAEARTMLCSPWRASVIGIANFISPSFPNRSSLLLPLLFFLFSSTPPPPPPPPPPSSKPQTQLVVVPLFHFFCLFLLLLLLPLLLSACLVPHAPSASSSSCRRRISTTNHSELILSLSFLFIDPQSLFRSSTVTLYRRALRRVTSFIRSFCIDHSLSTTILTSVCPTASASS